MLSLLLQIYLQLKRLRALLLLRLSRWSKPLLFSVVSPSARLDVPEDSERFETIWEDWLDGTGLDLEGEIEESLENSKFLMDMDDGTHAQWRGDHLGVLIMLRREDVEKLVEANHGQMNGGSVEDWLALSSWTMAFTDFLEQCLFLEEPD